MAASNLLPVPGLRLAAVSSGIRARGRLDTVVMELAPGAAVAATFTRNAFCAAPVIVAREHLARAVPRYLLVNTGNANAGTGAQGLADARHCCAELAAKAGVAAEEVLPFSTGVIGEPLPVAKIESVLGQALGQLDGNNWAAAAEGILTTDTRPKGASRTLRLDGRDITLTGIAKGAGMLRPNMVAAPVAAPKMATMLAYIATDAAVAPPLLQQLWSAAVERSFNRVTVDGDTSTNDAAVLMATGAAGNAPLNDMAAAVALRVELESLALELAQALVRDGEGASKFVTVDVQGGRDEAECLAVAYTIAHSPLVKTALFASDPNWGRLLAAIGRADIDALDVGRVELLINGTLIAEGGARAASYSEEQGQAATAPVDIHIEVRLHRGEARGQVWTTDLSQDYVRINADYRT